MGVRGRDGENVAETVEGDLILDGVDELAGDLVAGEGPVDLDGPESWDDLLLGVDPLRLLVAEVEGALEAEAGGALLSVVGWREYVVSYGELWNHDGHVLAVWPIEDARRVWEGLAVCVGMPVGGHERHLDLQAGSYVAVEQEALFLLVRLVEDDEAATGLERCRRCGWRRVDLLGETCPLAEVACSVEVGHTGGMVAVGGALAVAYDEVAVLLVEVSDVEEVEEAAQEVEVLWTLVIGDPSVAEALKEEGDEVHLAVGAGVFGASPAEAVFANHVRKEFDVLFREGAEGRELALAKAWVAVKLEGLASEDESHHAVEREGSADAFVADVVEIAVGAGFFDAGEEALDEATGFVLLGKSKGEAANSLGDVERLPVVVVVAAVEQETVEVFACLVYKAFPHGIAFLGWSEGEQCERGVCESVFLWRITEGLRCDAARGEVDEILAVKLGFSSGAVEFANSERGMAGLV